MKHTTEKTLDKKKKRKTIYQRKRGTIKRRKKMENDKADEENGRQERYGADPLSSWVSAPGPTFTSQKHT